MNTLLIALENKTRDDPRMALHPTGDGSTGDYLVDLISQVVPDYTAQNFVIDFARCYLYASGPAPRGKVRRQDIDYAANALTVAEILDVTDVVMIGLRVTKAFDQILGNVLPWLHSQVLIRNGPPIRFWAIPHPHLRNKWYDDAQNAAYVSRLLAMLRKNKVEET